MSKFQISIGIIAIALVSCQPTPTPNQINATANPATEKAVSYLRSQLKLSPNVAIAVEAQKLQPANTSDLCQTTAPTQDGFEVALIADNMRYILQTNQDASKIEICRSEDAKPETTGKYTGAGYTLRYPADWKAIDLGLEPSGASTVIFTPSRDVSENNLSLENLLAKMQQNQQPYAIVSRRKGKANVSDGVANARDLVTIPFDFKVKGAKNGEKKEFTVVTKSKSGDKDSTFSVDLVWKVKSLSLETDSFSYTVRYFQPDAKDFPNNSTAFEQFANSFALIP